MFSRNAIVEIDTQPLEEFKLQQIQILILLNMVSLSLKFKWPRECMWDNLRWVDWGDGGGESREGSTIMEYGGKER